MTYMKGSNTAPSSRPSNDHPGPASRVWNDVTNALKCYRRTVIAGVQSILSHHFNLTVELPLKAIIRGYSYAVVPNSWYNRQIGFSKLRLREMGSRYLFIVLYCFIERHLSRGDYQRE
jgi:dolichol-phosphate mannosyltransferase